MNAPKGLWSIYSMINFAGCIEGMTNRTVPSSLREYGCMSDLKSRINAGQRSNTGATVWWTPWSGGLQGLSACAELKSASHWSRNHGNPCAEKGMHTRSQQIFFGGGEDPTAKSNASKAGGLMKLRHPASNLFYEKTTTNPTVTK